MNPKLPSIILILSLIPILPAIAALEGNAVVPATTSASVPAVQSSAAGDDAVLKAAQDSLREKIKMSGTLDIYDDKIKMVRNLQTIEIHKDIAATAEGKVITVDYRDIKNGDVVVIEVAVSEKDGALKVTEPKIKEVKPLKTDFVKQFSEDDIQQYMEAQLGAQAKFSGYINLFDPDKNVMRKLKLISLDKEVRKLGVLNISRAQFKDIDTNEVLGVDVTVENRNAQLNLQALRIRQVVKGE